MDRKLKYILVSVIALAIVTVTILLTLGTQSDPSIKESSEETISAQTTVPEGSTKKNESSKEPTATTVVPTEESTLETTEAPSEGTGEMIQPEIPEDATGLLAYFRHKLTIDMSEVKYYLNVREEPSTDSEILAVLYANDLMTYEGTVGDWYKVTKDGETGYVHGGYVLADYACYEAFKMSVAYAAVTERDEVFLYDKPDTGSVKIICAEQAETYRVKGEIGDFYEVYVRSEIYQSLYVLKSDVILYSHVLGRGNDNGLTEEMTDYFASLDLTGNEELANQIIEEKAAYDRAIEESKAAKEASIQASVQASIAARQAEIERQLASGQAAYLGVFTVTGYCHCTKCNGIWGNDDPNAAAYGSSGRQLISDYSIAADISILPYGTHVLVNGHEYEVMDTGVYGEWIDIYRDGHDYAESIGMKYYEVYLLP